MKKRFSHIPVIPLGLDKEDISINKELIVDYDTNNIYLFNDNGIKPDDLITTMQKRLQEDRRHEIISPDQKKVYGVDINLNESDPTLSAKYVQDATGYKNFYIDQNTGEIDYGSWKEADCARRVLLKNKSVDVYYCSQLPSVSCISHVKTREIAITICGVTAFCAVSLMFTLLAFYYLP